MQDLFPSLKPLDPALNGQTITSSQNGNTIDRLGKFDITGFEIHSQTITTADGSNFFTFKLQHGDLSNASDMADCSGVDVTSQTSGGTPAMGTNSIVANDAAADNKYIGRLEYRGKKRYCRVVCTVTGTVSGFFIVTARHGNPRFSGDAS